jgi:uracil phosphoribosyltransferase
MSLTLLNNHALAQALLTKLRNRDTSAAAFAATAKQLGSLVASAACASAPTTPFTVLTPLDVAHSGSTVVTPVLIPILRAGLSLLPSFQELYDQAPIGFAGVKRNEQHEAVFYSWTVPSVTGKPVFLLDPMLATGGSAVKVIERLLPLKPGSIHFAGIVGTQQGVSALTTSFPEIKITLVTVDPILNANKYIVPGLGDYGDRLYGTC